MRRLSVTFWSLMCLAIPAGCVAQESVAAANEDPLKVLECYVGTWKTTAGPEDSPFAQGQYTTRWVLNGQFIETTGSLTTADGSNDFELKSLMTYDSVEKHYRIWSFFSTGMTSETTATWDDEKRTMTQVTQYGDIKQTTTSDFSETGVEKFKMVATDKEGNVVNELTGKNTRRGK